VFEGMSQVKSGPYRYFKHPNYLAVAIEIMVVPALLGAWYTALAFSIVNAALLLFVRIPAEERALQRWQRENRSHL
ncbi:MAG: isoprenylcysteine carboxylmethyltransferase family protein, partial [Desulfocapsaceae bacterium]